MAFKDIKVKLYGGDVEIDYRDKAHRYYKREKDPNGEWSKASLVRGVTTIKDATLEKKGLMTWPMGLALGELFGFYNFTNDQGEKMIGFSQGKGTLWRGDEIDVEWNKENALPLIKSASEAWFRQKKKGADIGSIVHDKIEQFLVAKHVGTISLEEYKAGQVFETAEDESAWDKKAAGEVEQANKALARFMDWWGGSPYDLMAAEQLVYSREMDVCGTFDAALKQDDKIILADWKTSNASSSRDAAAPQGVYYDFFVQLGFYAAAWEEMGNGIVDDLLVVSVRKDGNMDTKLASEVGLSVSDCIAWAKAVLICYTAMVKTKVELLKGANNGN